MRLFLISLVALFALAACSSGGGESAGDQAAQATPPASETEHAAGTEPAAETAAVVAMSGDVELAGKLGCGHCTHQIGTSCAAAVQTADGAIYILEDLGAGDELFDQRQSGKEVVVRGVSVERDGIGYVKVSGFDL